MSYAYDPLNRLTGATWDPAPAATAPTPGPLVTFGHSYNAVNQRVGLATVARAGRCSQAVPGARRRGASIPRRRR